MLRQAGRKRKLVITKTEVMYIPLIDTLQCQLNNPAFLYDVSLGRHYNNGGSDGIPNCFHAEGTINYCWHSICIRQGVSLPRAKIPLPRLLKLFMY